MALSILEKLGLVRPEAKVDAEETVPEILAISDRLEGLESGRAHFIALFAIVLARAGRADLEISDIERGVIERILTKDAEIPADQAALVGEMVAHHREVFGVSTDYLATRELADTATIGQRESILRCLFSVCAADDVISFVEEEEVRQIAGELGLDSEHVEAARKKTLDSTTDREARQAD